MEITNKDIVTEEVTLRKIVPEEGLCIHNKVTDTYILDADGKPTFIYLGKDEILGNYEKVPVEDVPRPEPPEETEPAADPAESEGNND